MTRSTVAARFCRSARVLVFVAPAVTLGLASNISAPAAAPPLKGTIALNAIAPPAGFENLLQPQDVVVDVYFIGRRLGTALVRFEGGRLQFEDPAALMLLLPGLPEPEAIARALAQSLPTHSELVCLGDGLPRCGTLIPEQVGIIFDEDRFRADLFFNAHFLPIKDPFDQKYLPAPAAGPSLVEILSGALSASDRTSTAYDLQSQTIVGFQEGRLRSNVSYSSQFGLLTDTLVVEIDRPGLRYSAGLFRSPGFDFVGQHRIYGVAISTQIDSRADREQAIGNQLVIYLARRSQVDVLRDGRPLSSQFYDAGNQIVDTTGLPDGAYNLELRIHEIGGETHNEQRFFVKDPQVPLFDQPIYFINGGFFAGNDFNPLSGSAGKVVVEMGSARRLSTVLAADLTLAGTDKIALADAGITYISDLFHARAAALLSTNDDVGASVSVAATSVQNVSANIYVKHVWSRVHLLAEDSTGPGATLSFDSANAQIVPAEGTQLSASLFYALGVTQFGVLGTYQSAAGQPTTAAFGPTVTSTLWSDSEGSGTLVGNASLSSEGLQLFLGLRVQFDQPDYTVVADGGLQANHLSRGAADRQNETGPVGSLVGTVTRDDTLDGDLALSARMERTLDQNIAGLSADLQGPHGSYHAAAEHDFGVRQPSTNYALNFTTAAAANTDDAAIGGANSFSSAIVVRTTGNAVAEFVVLVNGIEEGHVKVGEHLSIFLPPYKRYAVRLVPVIGPAIDFDANARDVVLFPGTVESLSWRVERLVDVFGRAVRADGTPVVNARILGASGRGTTDDEGYFQIEASAAARLIFQSEPGTDCAVDLPDLTARGEYVSVDSLVCK